MQNWLVFVVEMIFYMLSVMVIYRYFGKNGLVAYMVFSMLFANIQVLMMINIFGAETTGGNAIFASMCLVTDLMSEKYGKKQARRAVFIGFAFMVAWLVATQLTLLYTPNDADTIFPALKEIFAIAPRVTLASLVAYLCSQLADVQIYQKIWEKTGGGSRMLWLRNNGSTLISQLIDTLIFCLIAFYGTVDTSVFISIAVTTYLFKAAISLFDTPFMYLARRLTPVKNVK